MDGRQGRWWGPYLASVTTIEVEVRRETQQVRVRTFHLPPDPSVSADDSWRAETVVTLDDLAVVAFGPTEEQALLRLGEEVQNTWAERVERQRGASPRVGDHLNVARPEDVSLNETWLSVHWDREHGCVHAEFKGFTASLE